MRTKLRSKFTLLFMVFAVMLALPAIALADQITGDADNDALDTPHPNSKSANQAPGSTASYDFSAYIKETGNANDDVFKNTGDYVSVNIARSGDWLASNAGSPADFTFTKAEGYGFAENGTVAVKVPCGATGSKTMTVTLTGTAKNAGTDGIIGNADDVTLPNDRQLSNTLSLTYTITASGAQDASCTADTTAPNPPSTPDLDAGSDSGSSNTDNITNDNKPDFSGTAEANSTVELFAGANSLGTVTADSSGNWYFDGDSLLTSALADGTYSITAKATDASNNTSGASGALSVTIDTAIATPAAPDLDANSDSGSSSTDNITNDSTPTFNGTAEAGSSVSVLVNGVAQGSGTATGGNYSITTSTLTDGTYSVTVKATDVAGNVSLASSALSVTIDTVVNAPTNLDLATASDSGSSSTDDITNDSTPTINGSAENNSSVELFEGTNSLGTGTASATGSWSITSSTLSDGVYTFKAKATDVAGNVSALSSGLSVTIDTTAPVVSFVNASAFSGNPSFYFGDVPAAPTCSADDGSTCAVSGYGTTVGSHTLTASATDLAGNLGSATPLSYTVLAWTLDGFKSPVDMGILNNAKAGSTVPLKFEVFKGATELTSTSIVSAFTQKVSCAAGTGDDIEQYATGSTSLRYDTTGGQFIFNWQTPKAAGSCYRVTLTTLDGSTIFADFRLK